MDAFPPLHHVSINPLGALCVQDPPMAKLYTYDSPTTLHACDSHPCYIK